MRAKMLWRELGTPAKPRSKPGGASRRSAVPSRRDSGKPAFFMALRVRAVGIRRPVCIVSAGGVLSNPRSQSIYIGKRNIENRVGAFRAAALGMARRRHAGHDIDQNAKDIVNGHLPTTGAKGLQTRSWLCFSNFKIVVRILGDLVVFQFAGGL